MAAPPENSKSRQESRRISRSRLLLAVVAASLIGVLSIGVYHVVDRNAASSDMAGAPGGTAADQARTGSDGTPPASEPSAPANSPLASSARSADDAQDSSRRLLEALSEEADSGLSISGAVLDDGGQLLGGATVSAALVSPSGTEESGIAATANPPAQVTDTLGSFEFLNLQDGEYQLSATKGEDYFPASMKVRAGMANAELILQRFRTVIVYGVLSDEAGTPLEGVKVRALGTDINVQSDPAGGYRIVTAPVRAGTAPVLDFSLEGFQDTRRRVEAALDPEVTEAKLDVRLEADTDQPKVTVAGQVMDPKRMAVPDQSVQLKSFRTQAAHRATTNESGEFNFPEVAVGEGYTLSVMPSEEYEAYESDVFSLGPEDEYHEIQLEAVEHSRLSGVVTDLEGSPLGNFTLWLRGVGTSAQSQVAVQTDGAGRFDLEGLRAGEVRLESRSQPLLRAKNIVLEPGKHRHIQVPLDWGSDWLLGRVVDPEGRPVSGARVVVSWQDEFWSIASESRRDTRSDLEGYFTVSNLGAQAYTLSVQAPGYGSTQVQHQLGRGGDEVQILLPVNGAAGGGGG